MGEPGGARGAIRGAEVSALLDALGGAPRPAGGEREAAARAHAREHLEAGGFVVDEEVFTYSAFPGRWATALSGAAAIGVVSLAGHAGARGSPVTALIVLATGTALIGGIALWLARRGVLDTPLLRRQGVNLVARRADARDAAEAIGPSSREPRVWLMAHTDSKSQPVPILVRAAAITISVLLVLAGGVLAAAQALGGGGREWWPALTIMMVIALLPVAASVVGTDSDGAIDNAAGCAAVLLAARHQPAGTALGVVLTSAEELGLAGGRAFARKYPPATCINCDGLDDEGRWTAMYSGSTPEGVLAAVARAASRTGMLVRPRRLLPGVLMDSVALADAGWQVVTISHGSIATLGRVHTPRDSRANLRGNAIAAAALLIATIVEEVR